MIVVMYTPCRDSVMHALDPHGCRQRRQKRLTRRQYISKVNKHTVLFKVLSAMITMSWPVYIGTQLYLAKLKRFGFAIHDCIDGLVKYLKYVYHYVPFWYCYNRYSCKLLNLTIILELLLTITWSTSKNYKVCMWLYLAVCSSHKHIIGVPKILLLTVVLKIFTLHFCNPTFAVNADGSASFRYAKSVSNQVCAVVYIMPVYTLNILSWLYIIAYWGLVVTTQEVVHSVVAWFFPCEKKKPRSNDGPWK